MGVSVALPAAMPRGGSRETTGEDPRDERGLTDGDLISRVARRDANAFELLYRRYARPVFGLALRRLGDRMRAEDAVQETLVAALAHHVPGKWLGHAVLANTFRHPSVVAKKFY